MDNLQSQMNAVLQDPEMMERIMSMAQALGGSRSPQKAAEEPPAFSLPDIDPATLQKLSGFLGQSRIDKDQQLLLQALNPYLNRQHIAKLEKAMRAAKLAGLASTLLAGAGFRAGGGG